MNFAVIDTIKWEDLPNDNHSSKNIWIPLNKGMLLSVLNEKPITSSTSTIEVKISADEGFDPQTDVDVNSLRFGSHSEVNFGRGCKPVKWRNEGKDLIVVFKGKGSGITEDEFAPKMIGKNKNGDMVYGYASLPYVNYRPALLSSRRPVYNKDENEVKLEVQNFGLSASEVTQVEVLCNGVSIGKSDIKVLQPYEKKDVTFSPQATLAEGELKYEVVFSVNGVEIERNRF